MDERAFSVLLGEAPRSERNDLLHLVQTGDFAKVLNAPLAHALLLDSDPAGAEVASRARQHLLENADSASSIIAVGAAALSLFTHANWTGAPIAKELSSASYLAVARCSQALDALEVDGEPAYALLECPRLLCAARALLVEPVDDLSVSQSLLAPWWAARCAMLHQRCLESAAPSLEKLATRGMRQALEALYAQASATSGTAPTAAGTGAAEGAPGRLRKGAGVLVHSLEGRPELNGQRGVLGDYDEAKGRYAVKLQGGGTPMLLKADNLVLGDGLATSLGAAGGDEEDGGRSAWASGSDAGAGDERTFPLAWATLGVTFRDTVALAHLELAVALLYHKRSSTAAVALGAAKGALGIAVRLTGALGRRTKFQEKATSLLVLQVTQLTDGAAALPRETSAEAEGALAAAEAAEAGVPGMVTEEDDTLHATPRLEGDDAAADAVDVGDGAPAPQEPQVLPLRGLRSLEQQVLLAEMGYIEVSRPMHESTIEEMEPYVRAALALPRRWATVSAALRLKARFESNQKRRRHQALMQLQALMDDVRPPAGEAEGSLLSRHIGVTGDDDPAASSTSDLPTTNAFEVAAAAAAGLTARMESSRLSARLRGFWGVAVQPRWHLGAELARTLAALGLLSEAATLFKELALWEECASAMALIGQSAAAEAMVRERIEAEPTPGLWAQLGDLSQDEACYHTAWELSNGRCSRAKLKLGSACIQREEWAAAREHLKAALAVKGHYAEAWYCCAVCLLKLEDPDGALVEMRKVIAVDPTHHQAWSALGGIFAKKRMKREALLAFREASKLQSHNAELWMHTALAALDLGHFHETVLATKRALDFGGAPAPQISSLLSQAVASDLKDEGDGRRTRTLLDRVRTILTMSCERAPTYAAHWEAALHLAQKCGGPAEERGVLELQLAAYREHTKWTKDPTALEAVVEVAAQLVESQLESTELALFKAAKKLVDELLYAASEHLAASSGAEQLRMLEARVKRHDEDD